MPKATLYEQILELANDCPPVKPLSMRHKKHDPTLSTSQKRINTSILNTSNKIKDLQLILNGLLTQKRSLASHDITSYIPETLNNKIKSIKLKLQRNLNKLRLYQSGIYNHRKPIYIDKFIPFDGKHDNHYILMDGIIDHEWGHQAHWFQDNEPLDKQYLNEGNRRYLRRLRYLRLHCTRDGLYLEAKDWKWMIHHIGTMIKKMERHRAMNLYLPKPIDTDKEANEKYRREGKRSGHQKKYPVIELDDLEYMRDLSTLMLWFGFQMRDDERDYVIHRLDGLRAFFYTQCVQKEPTLT